jgi:fido (protein-threonine AMPylation protein)
MSPLSILLSRPHHLIHTLKQISGTIREIPAQTAWYLADISEFKGKQELYTRQSPQKLKVLREHALIESAVSSNRIEGVEIDRKRVGTVVFGRPLLKDRDEEEIQGYRDALEWLHTQNADIKANEATIKKLHKLSRGNIWDEGKYKEKDGDIIERLPTGDTRVRFTPVSAAKTPLMMREMVSLYSELIKQHKVHPLLAITACNLDFLCIHPFRDGNGRVSRLLLLLQLYHAGYEVGRYISLERLIEEHKERYYETLRVSSEYWHDGRHDPWPYMNFLLYLLKKAYVEFAGRIDKIETPKGGKTALVIEQIRKMQSGFSLAQLQEKCPDVSYDMIRKVLKDLKTAGRIKAEGRGVSAQWHKKGNTL